MKVASWATTDGPSVLPLRAGGGGVGWGGVGGS